MEEGEKVSETTSQVLSVGCSSFHVLRRTSGGLLSVFGLNAHSQLGRARSGGLLTHALEIGGPFKIKIMQIATGFNHTLFLLADATVFGCGGNQHGQLGFDGLERVDTPCQVQISSSNGIEQRIEQIACGTGFSVFLAEGGTVFFLGTLRGSEKRVWIHLPDPGKAVQIACGGHHYAFLMENGDMYVSGENAYGQHGYSQNTSEEDSPSVPFKVKIDEMVTSIACGLFHTLALASSGKVYSFGMNLYGQLGHGGRRITGLARCVQYLSPEDGKVVGLAAGARSSTLYTENKILIFGEVFDLETLESSVYVEEPREIIESEASLMQSYLLILCPNKWSERELHVELERRGRYWRDAVVFGLAEYSSIGQPFWPMAIEDAKNLAMQDTVSLGVLPHAALKFVSTQHKYAPKHMSNLGIFLKNPSPNMPIALYREASGYYFRIKKLEKSIQMEKNVIKIASAGEMQDKIELATSHVFIGECEAKLGRKEEAIRHLELGIDLAAVVKGGNGIVGSCSFHLAKISEDRGNLADAMELYASALASWRKEELAMKYSADIYESLLHRGLCALMLDKCYEGIESLREAIVFRETIVDTIDDGAVLHQLIGSCYQKLRQLENAIIEFQIAIKLSPESDVDTKATTYEVIGECFFDLGNWEEAIVNFKLSLDNLIKLHGKNSGYLSTPYSWLGSCYYFMSEYSASLEFHEFALKILLEDPTEKQFLIAERKFDMGNCLRKLGRYSDAISMFKDSYELQNDMGEYKEALECLLLIGVCYFGERQFEMAVDSFDEVIVYAPNFPSLQDLYMSKALENSGLCHFLMDEFQVALDKFEGSRDLLTKTGEIAPEALVRLGYSCGLCFHKLKRYWRAFSEFNRSLAISRGLGMNDGNIAAILFAMGTTHYVIGDYEAARSKYTAAVAIFENDIAKWRGPSANARIGIGTCLLSQELVSEAKSQFEKSKMVLAEGNGGDSMKSLCDWYLNMCNGMKRKEISHR